MQPANRASNRNISFSGVSIKKQCLFVITIERVLFIIISFHRTKRLGCNVIWECWEVSFILFDAFGQTSWGMEFAIDAARCLVSSIQVEHFFDQLSHFIGQPLPTFSRSGSVRHLSVKETSFSCENLALGWCSGVWKACTDIPLSMQAKDQVSF